MSKYYVPFPLSHDGESSTRSKNAAFVLSINLPAHVLFPDTCGAFSDLYLDPDKVRYMNIFLFLLSCADFTGVPAYIETIPDYEYMEGGVGVMPLFYRLIIVLNEVECKTMMMRMASILIPDIATGDGVPDNGGGGGRSRKRRRKESNSAAAGSTTSTEETTSFQGVTVSHAEISSENAIMQYHAMVNPGRRDDRELEFCPLPPDAVSYGGGGGMRNAGDDGADSSDSDSDDDVFNPFNTDDNVVSEGFKQWKEMLSDMNILSIFSFKSNFSNGMKDVPGPHEIQQDISNYYDFDAFEFQFPDFVFDNGLVVRIPPHWPGYNGSVDSLFKYYMMPGAFYQMKADDILQKMEGLARFQGIEIDPEIYDWPVEDLKKRFLTHGCFEEPYVDGPMDASIKSPILCRSAVENDYTATNSDKTLGNLYPAESQLRLSVKKWLERITVAVEEERLTATHLYDFRDKYIRIADQLYNGPAIEGFCPSTFAVARETKQLKRDFDATRKAAIVDRALADIHKPRQGMSPGPALLANIADMYLHHMHLTNAQAGVAMLYWACSVTTLRWTINCLQLTVLLLGPQDKGKSLAMDASLFGVPLSIQSTVDTGSAKSHLTPEKPCAVKKQDEFDIGPNTLVSWLPSRSEGTASHNQTIFDAKQKNPMRNNLIIADTRYCLITASNGYDDKKQKGPSHTGSFPPQVLSRCMPFHFLGSTQSASARSRHELASVPDGPAFFAAGAALKYIWAHCNDCSRIETIMPFSYNFCLHPVFVSVLLSTFGQKRIQTRDIARFKRCAISFLQLRLFGEWIKLPDGPNKPATFPEFVFSNPVVLLQDYLQVFIQQASNVEYEISEEEVISVLKDSVILKEGAVDAIETDGAEWYITSCKSASDIQQLCSGGLSQSPALVKDILAKLKTPEVVDGSPRVRVITKRGDFTGFLAINKDLTAGTHSKLQKKLLDFIAEEVIVPTREGKEDQYQILHDETGVVLRRGVKLRLLNQAPPNTTLPYADSVRLLRLNLTGKGAITALLLFEGHGMQFRKDTYGSDDINVDAAHLSSIPGQPGGVSVGRAGIFDELRMLGDDYAETPDEEITDEWIAERSQERRFTTLPKRETRKKFRIQALGGIKVDMQLVQRRLDNMLLERLGGAPIPEEERTVEERKMKLRCLVDKLVGITGEEKVGNAMFMGIDQAGPTKFETHVVRPLHAPFIDVKNPLRNKFSGGGDDLAELILDPKKPTVRFYYRPEGERPLAERLNKLAAKKNGMPQRFVKRF